MGMGRSMLTLTAYKLLSPLEQMEREDVSDKVSTDGNACRQGSYQFMSSLSCWLLSRICKVTLVLT